MRAWLPRVLLLFSPIAACASRGGGDWVTDAPDEPDVSGDVQPLTSARPTSSPDEAAGPPPVDAGAEEPVLIKEHGRPRPAPAPKPDPSKKFPKGGDKGGVTPSPEPTSRIDPDALFRNTYYDFPREGSGDKTAALFDGSCSPIARVTRTFHDDVCVQGSGRLATGETVSFAKRDCECAHDCPRTGQKICFDKLDPARFPHGRGATGGPITPLRTVAVDSAVIPLGTVIYVPELVGLPLPDQKKHDGCFVAEDRGIKVVGRQIDVFTGDPAMTARYNALYPSNRGVHVRLNEPRCKGLKALGA